MIEILNNEQSSALPVIVENIESGCWIDVVDPTLAERKFLRDELGIVDEFLVSAFDSDESPHVDFDDDEDQLLIIFDCPVEVDASELEEGEVQYETKPLSIVVLMEEELIVTLSRTDNTTINSCKDGRIRRVRTAQRTKLLLQILLDVSRRYLSSLRRINRKFENNESELRERLKNEELIKMLGLQKSLVYFSTSLKANENVLNRIKAGRVLPLYEEDKDLLDDVLIELRQAMEMCSITTSLLEGTMDTFSSIISNNTNTSMRILTIIMIVMTLPTIIFSFYGMNVEGLPHTESWALPIVLAALFITAAIIVFTIVSKVSKRD